MFSPDMVAPTEEPIDQVDNNFDVLEYKEQSLVNERVEEPKSIAKNRPRRVIRKPARFDDTIAYAFSLIDELLIVTKMLSRARIAYTGKRM